jgi:ParB-like chromosome segregation protein Spo0J
MKQTRRPAAMLATSNQELKQLAAQIFAFHPLANKFPLMVGKEFAALVADIEANGLREKITLYQGKILDGRNRYRATFQAGIESQFEQFEGDEAAATAFVISKNIHRRHLKPKEKRDLIAQLIKAQPEKSDRQIAEQVKVSPTTVGTVRTKMEASGEVSKLDTRRDRRGHPQPAKRAWSRERWERHRAKKGGGRKTEVTTTAKTIVPTAPKDQSHRQDIGSDSAGEADKRRLEIENIGLRSEIEETQAAHKPDGEDDGEGLGNLLRAWDRASYGAREQFKARVGLVAADGLDMPDFLDRTREAAS